MFCPIYTHIRIIDLNKLTQLEIETLLSRVISGSSSDAPTDCYQSVKGDFGNELMVLRIINLNIRLFRTGYRYFILTNKYFAVNSSLLIIIVKEERQNHFPPPPLPPTKKKKK